MKPRSTSRDGSPTRRRACLCTIVAVSVAVALGSTLAHTAHGSTQANLGPREPITSAQSIH